MNCGSCGYFLLLHVFFKEERFVLVAESCRAPNGYLEMAGGLMY